MNSDEAPADVPGGGRRPVAAEMPTTCAACFSASVETCATTGLGLDALSSALLELANAPSLASGPVCMPVVCSGW